MEPVGTIEINSVPQSFVGGWGFAADVMTALGQIDKIVIGLQNIPDGFAFAVPVSQSGVSVTKVFLYTTLSGTVPQVVASIFGYGLVGVVQGVFSVAAGFVAGAMLTVVLREIVSSIHGHGYADASTAVFLVGFVLLVVVDAAIAL